MGGLGRRGGHANGAEGPIGVPPELSPVGVTQHRLPGRLAQTAGAKQIGGAREDARSVPGHVEIAEKRQVGSREVGNKTGRLPGGRGRLALRGGAEGAVGGIGTATGWRGRGWERRGGLGLRGRGEPPPAPG